MAQHVSSHDFCVSAECKHNIFLHVKIVQHGASAEQFTG
jgi:hypothetical protein